MIEVIAEVLKVSSGWKISFSIELKIDIKLVT